jgi:hypothetical protein
MPDALETNDVLLTANDVGQLENHARIVELFGRLGYDVDEAQPSPKAARNSFLRQFLAGERDKLTLGSMQIILASSKEAALLADDTAVALRNAAAHDQLMTRADAQAARAWAVGILEKL